MNWFDTSGIASLAKNALKEAQKQIDKALDIKDDDDATGVGMDGVSLDSTDEVGSVNRKIERPESATSDQLQKLENQIAHRAPVGDTSSAAMTDADGSSGEGSVRPDPTTNVGTTMWGSFTGSFFEHPTGAAGNITVTKPPASLKRKSFEDSGSREVPKTSFKEHPTSGCARDPTPIVSPPSASPPTEKDSSESIEILSPVTTPISALTSPSQLPSDGVRPYDDQSESVEVLGTLGTASSVSSPESLTTVDPSVFPEHDASDERGYRVLTGIELHHATAGDHDDDISVEDDSVSYTLSEQPITVMESSSRAPPITVAPTRSSLHLTLASTEELIESEATAEGSGDKRQQQLQQEDQDLDRSYENVEIQTQISDSTQSFEEITPSGSVLGGESGELTHGDDEEMLRTGGSATAIGLAATGTAAATGVPPDGGGVQSSGPNSGDDEVETTTSSDIEIISSPNGGDSSSTHSNGAYRTSPLKIRDGKNDDIDILLIKKHRGHTRQPSEVSVHSGNSDESGHQSETERLMRRLAEVSETLEQREYRLVELGRQNAELQDQNAALASQLESKARRAADGGTDSEGYTQRLSALERKFQQSIREKEVLKRQLDALRAEEQQKVARGEVDKALAERDFIISELQKEGESLSKQVLQHSNIIKKLRVKEKECDTLIRKQREEIGELVEEAERLKRSLSAKEEVERSQIDAVHKLSSDKQKLERDCVLLKGNLDDQAQRLETLRKSFDCARKELSEQAESHRELLQRSTKLQTIETEHDKMTRASEQLGAQLEEVREQLRRTEHDYGQRLLRAKQEHAELLARLEATETRAEEEKNAAALLTVPLMKQLESLQNTLRHKEHVWEQRDAAAAQQLADALDHTKSNAERERTQRDQIASLQGRIANLEERLTAALFKVEETTNELLQKQLDAELLERDLRKRLAAGEDERLALSDRLHEKERLVSKLEQRVHPDRTGPQDAHVSLRSRGLDHPSAPSLHNPYHPQRSTGPHEDTGAKPADADTSGDSPTQLYDTKRGASESSPTPSIGNLSLSESLGSIPWNVPEDETGSLEASSGFPEGAAGVGGPPVCLLNNTSLLETLQATLKQRDGEVHQLQWELSRFQQERNVLNAEISNLTMELDNIREKCERSVQVEEEHSVLQKRYDALLQMYGESVEKTEELRLDLVDVKEMYKLQIDDLLRQQRELMASINSNQHPILSP